MVIGTPLRLPPRELYAMPISMLPPGSSLAMYYSVEADYLRQSTASERQ